MRSVFILLAAALAAWSAEAAAAPADMRAACARSGNDDRMRPIDASLVAAARKMFGLSADAPAGWIAKSTVARCMGGRVWLCNYGANIPCGKADTRRVNPGAVAFCKEHPGSGIAPMSATGHATIYSFTCRGAKARVERKFGSVDKRGFVAGSWKRLE